METLYRKVQSSERNPTIEENYDTSRGLLSYSKVFGWITIQNYTTPNPEYWLELIPDPTAQLQADKEELIEKLEEIYGYLGSHFDGEKVSIGELIQKHKQ